MDSLGDTILALGVLVAILIFVDWVRDFKKYYKESQNKFMSNRKYVNTNETPQAYECTKEKCSWQGEHQEKHKRYSSDGWATSVCPNCGNDEFYGLVEKPKKPANTKLKGSY